MEYTTCYDNLLAMFDSIKRPYTMKAHTADDYKKWKKALRAKLKEITGLEKALSCPLSCEIRSRVGAEGHTRIKAVLATEQNVYTPLYILIPDGMKPGEKRACIIAVHGHGAAGKESVAGVRERPDVCETIDRFNGDYGLQLVREGYIVFCPDARGSGERREKQEQGGDTRKYLSSSCNNLNFAAVSMGRSLIGMWIWDLMKLIDYIGTLDYCDSNAIACCGFSGGGLQTLWLSAMDDRIRCAVISGYFHSYRDALMKTNFCGCNFVPHLWENAELGDIAALIAPRPLLIESGDYDPLNGPRGLADVYEQLETVKKAYSVFGKKERLVHHVFSGFHQYNGGKTAEFLHKYL